jgi:hypothetical protein
MVLAQRLAFQQGVEPDHLRTVGVAVTDAALHEKTADFDFFDYEADETKPVD